MSRVQCAAVAVLLALAVAAQALQWKELVVEEQHLYSFEDYALEFRHKYNVQEMALRRQIFADNLLTIVTHNRQTPRPSYTMGVNHFTDLSSSEFAQRLGLNKALARTYNASSQKPTPAHLLTSNKAGDLPPYVDWREKGVISDVKDQGRCGSCWAFGAVETIESYVALSTTPPTVMSLSPQQILECAKNPDDCGGLGGCQGSIVDLAYDMVKENGMTTEWVLPYTSHNGKTCQPDCQCTYDNSTATIAIDGFVKLPSNNYDAVINALATVGPLAVNVNAKVFQHYSTGVFPAKDCGRFGIVDIDHVMQLVGYGVDGNTPYWLVRNSWTPLWGERGYIRLEREPANPCFKDNSPTDGTGCAKGPNPSPPSVTVCGTCGITYDVTYITGAKIL